MLEVCPCRIGRTAAHAIEVAVGEVNPYRSNQNRRHTRPGGPAAHRHRSSWTRRRGCCRRPSSAAGSDTHVVQIEVTGRVVEYEMQVSVRSGYHIGKSILRIAKGGLRRLRYKRNTTKGSPKTIVVSGIGIVEPKGHVIGLARHGRDYLIRKTVASGRTGLLCVGSRVRQRGANAGKRSISAYSPRWKATSLETTVNNKARNRGRRRSKCCRWRRRSCGRGGWRRASCRGSAYHEADKDILLRVAADNPPPIGPTANGRLPHRAVVVVVALVGWLYPRIGLSRQAR